MFTRLERRCQEVNSILCVGLDPHLSELRVSANASASEIAQACEQFCFQLIDDTHAVACAYKPNAAFFETLGVRGAEVLERVCEKIRLLGIPIIYDAKRGDISTTAEAYAHAAYEVLHADGVTVNPYMGFDSVSPFLGRGGGVFVLCKTSNPSSSEFQTLPTTTGGRKLFEQIAAKCAGEWSNAHPNEIGLVVGATDLDSLAAVRKVASEIWILAPGVGFQGGDLAQTIQLGVRQSDKLGLVVPISRGISRHQSPKQAAIEFRDQLNAARFAAPPPPSKQLRLSTFSSASSNQALLPYQEEFFSLAIEAGVLKFGSFTLKSGRVSPYFFNAGLFNTGKALSTLAACYCETILSSKVEYDILFGPAYKGIPLVSTIASEFYVKHGGLDKPICYNRKEEKAHGEGGVLVGASVWKPGTRVLVVDDVITAGTAVRESISIIQKNGGVVAGLVVALDRQEIAGGDKHSTMSAVEAVEAEYGFPVFSVANLRDLLVYCNQHETTRGGVLDSIAQYREQYGTKTKKQ